MTAHRKPILHAQAVDAGAMMPWMEPREDGPPQRKGGWIELNWEKSPGEFEVRRICVSHQRALEAIRHLQDSRSVV